MTPTPKHTPIFGIQRLLEAYKDQNIHEALTRIRRNHCAYLAPHSDQMCDCKFGADHIGEHCESGNGCPEIRYAQDMCSHLAKMAEHHDKLVEALRIALRAIGTGDTYHICVGPGPNDTLGDHLKAALAAVEGE